MLTPSRPLIAKDAMNGAQLLRSLAILMTGPPAIWEDLGADSLDGCELVMAFEEEFDIDISCDDSASWKTVGDVMRTVNAILEKKKAATSH